MLIITYIVFFKNDLDFDKKKQTNKQSKEKSNIIPTQSKKQNKTLSEKHSKGTRLNSAYYDHYCNVLCL